MCVFSFRGERVERMNNTAWQRARREAILPMFGFMICGTRLRGDCGPLAYPRKIAQRYLAMLAIGIDSTFVIQLTRPQFPAMSDLMCDTVQTAYFRDRLTPAWFHEHRKSVDESEAMIKAHIRPTLGEMVVASLRAEDIGEWRDKLSQQHACKTRS